jgi:hypothetical protein
MLIYPLIKRRLRVGTSYSKSEFLVIGTLLAQGVFNVANKKRAQYKNSPAELDVGGKGRTSQSMRQKQNCSVAVYVLRCPISLPDAWPSRPLTPRTPMSWYLRLRQMPPFERFSKAKAVFNSI